MEHQELIQYLENHQVKFIRCIWTDNANIIRAKAIHRNIIADHIDYPVSISEAQQSVPGLQDLVVEGTGLSPVGEIFLKPDWRSLKILPYSSAHASVICDLHSNQREWEHCPRSFLKRMIQKAQSMGLVIKSSFENEFYLYRKTEKGEVLFDDKSLFASFQSYNQNEDLINEISDQLDQQNLKVMRYYPESGFGQHEISIEHREALESADNQIHFRNTVKAVAHQKGYIANFMAKPFEDLAGSGCHIHISIEKEGKNIFNSFNSNDENDLIAKQSLAGIMYHLPSIMAISTPGINSFKRIKPHFWSGAYNCWGYDNREAAIRVISHADARQISHFELKTSDATANPYLALGIVIASMLYGIENQLSLIEPVAYDPGYMPKSVLKEKKINLLPEDFDVALYHYLHNNYFKEVLGEKLFQSYYFVKKYEMDNTIRLKSEEFLDLFEEKY